MLEQGRIYIGHLGPIPLYIHWSFLFLVMLAFGWSPPTTSDGLSSGLIILIALMLGIVLHELGHGMAAKVQGATDVTITLWGLGGLCSSQRQSTPFREIIILAAGPAVSAALAWGSGLAFEIIIRQAPHLLIQGHSLTTLGEFLLISNQLNWMLFVFNILPIFPLDGGQITYYAALLTTRKHATAARFSLILACIGAGAFFWWRTAGFTDFSGNIFYSFFLIGWLLWNAFSLLRR